MFMIHEQQVIKSIHLRIYYIMNHFYYDFIINHVKKIKEINEGI